MASTAVCIVDGTFALSTAHDAPSGQSTACLGDDLALGLRLGVEMKSRSRPSLWSWPARAPVGLENSAIRQGRCHAVRSHSIGGRRGERTCHGAAVGTAQHQRQHRVILPRSGTGLGAVNVTLFSDVSNSTTATLDGRGVNRGAHHAEALGATDAHDGHLPPVLEGQQDGEVWATAADQDEPPPPRQDTGLGARHLSGTVAVLSSTKTRASKAVRSTHVE